MTALDDNYHPDDFDKDFADAQQELREELIDYNDSMARCHDEGWFYADSDADSD